MAIMNLNGSGVEVPDAIVPMVQAQLDKDANTIESLESTVADSTINIDTLQAAVDASVIVVGDLESKVADAESAMPDVEAVLAFRASVMVVDAQYDCAGKSEIDVMRDVVQASIGDSIVLADKSDDYVAARFDILVEGAKAADSDSTDLLSQAFSDTSTNIGDAVSATEKARAAKIARSQKAWETKV